MKTLMPLNQQDTLSLSPRFLLSSLSISFSRLLSLLYAHFGVMAIIDPIYLRDFLSPSLIDLNKARTDEPKHLGSNGWISICPLGNKDGKQKIFLCLLLRFAPQITLKLIYLMEMLLNQKHFSCNEISFSLL